MAVVNPGCVRRGIVAVRAESPDADVKAVIQTLHKAFHDFKDEHTRQLEEIKKGVNDPLQAEKVERINTEIEGLQASLDEISLKLASIEMGGGTDGPKDREYTEAFLALMKRGDIQAALNKGKDDEGGYLAPAEWDRTITDKLVEVSPMRQIAHVQTTSRGAFTKLYNKSGTSSGWVGETADRDKTNTAKFSPLTFEAGEIYANPAATQQILDDSEINLEQWLAGEVQTEFAKQEGLAFVSGNGANKPFGVLTYVTGGANAAKHPFGAIGALNSGAAAAITADSIIDIVYELPSAFTGGARFIMNRKTMGAVRKLKDDNDNYLWQPSYLAGQPSTLSGFPVTEMPDMPDVAANAIPLMFGDFKQGYLIVDRTGVRVLRDPYTEKPYVLFYSTKRVGGGVVNPESLRALKIAE